MWKEQHEVPLSQMSGWLSSVNEQEPEFIFFLNNKRHFSHLFPVVCSLSRLRRVPGSSLFSGPENQLKKIKKLIQSFRSDKLTFSDLTNNDSVKTEVLTWSTGTQRGVWQPGEQQWLFQQLLTSLLLRNYDLNKTQLIRVLQHVWAHSPHRVIYDQTVHVLHHG